MINIAIMGYGTIGSGVYQIIEDNQEILKKQLHDEIRVKKVLDLRSFPGEPVDRKIVHDIEDILSDDEIDMVIETMGGTEPAYGFVKSCLVKGKHVATSNKALVAAYGTDLLNTAREHDVNFMFEASVGGGIPIIRTLTEAYAGEEIVEITGILNGTTNYILTKMDEEGESFEAALSEAQKLGYAERNPEADVEGFDTCRKIAILASLATGKQVNYEDIYTEGITKIDKVDFEYAQKMGTSVKLFGSAKIEDGKLYAYVCPAMIGKPHILYTVRDVFNGIMVEGNMVSKTMLYGSGAGKLPTASAVVADIVAAMKSKHNIPMGWSSEVIKPEDIEKTSHRYFVRFKGKADEDIEKAQKVFGKTQTFFIDGKDEFAILTGYMREKDYLAVSQGFGNIIKMIRAEMDK